MNEIILISANKFIELFAALPEWLGDPARPHWLEMFECLSGTPIQCRWTEKAYIVDLYEKRLANAEARGEVLSGLKETTRKLSQSAESVFAFAVVNHNGFGYFMWTDLDASHVISYWRAPDRHTPEP